MEPSLPGNLNISFCYVEAILLGINDMQFQRSPAPPRL